MALLKNIFLILILLFSATVGHTKVDSKQFMQQVQNLLNEPEKFSSLSSIYENQLYHDVSFSETKSIMVYWEIYPILDKRVQELDLKVKQSYESYKDKFKQRMLSVSTKTREETSADLEMFTTEFIKGFLSYHREIFIQQLFDKLNKGKPLDPLDQAVFFLLYFDYYNLFPFMIKTLHIKTFPLDKSNHLLILAGEREDSCINYSLFYFDNKSINKINSEQGTAINICPKYNQKRTDVLLQWDKKGSKLIFNNEAKNQKLLLNPFRRSLRLLK